MRRRGAAPRRQARVDGSAQRAEPAAPGYTLIEVIIAMAVTLGIALSVFYFYANLSEGRRRAEQELQTLSAFRQAVQLLERHLKFVVAKSGYVPGPPAQFKPLHNGMFRIQWPGASNHLDGYADGRYQDGKCRYLGFYTSEDGVHVDRVEYYFNPPEPPALCGNGLDDDHDDDPDDAANPLHLMRDDRGRLMLRQVKDTHIQYNQYHNQPPSGADNLEAPAFPAFRAPHLTGKPGSEYDRGEIVAEGYTDIYFEFLYTHPGEQGRLEFRYAPHWPHNSRFEDTTADDTGELWPRDNADGRQPRGLSFIALPLAVRVTCEYQAGAETRRYLHTILLPQSQWHEYTARARP